MEKKPSAIVTSTGTSNGGPYLVGLSTPTEHEFRQLASNLTLGDGNGVFVDFRLTNESLGWKLLCSPDASLQHPLDGVIETDQSRGLTRVRLLYNQSPSHTPLAFLQEPRTYEEIKEVGTVAVETIGHFDARLWESGPDAGASFDTGEIAGEEKVVGVVIGKNFGLARIRAFVQSLTFDCNP